MDLRGDVVGLGLAANKPIPEALGLPTPDALLGDSPFDIMLILSLYGDLAGEMLSRLGLLCLVS